MPRKAHSLQMVYAHSNFFKLKKMQPQLIPQLHYQHLEKHIVWLQQKFQIYHPYLKKMLIMEVQSTFYFKHHHCSSKCLCDWPREKKKKRTEGTNSVAINIYAKHGEEVKNKSAAPLVETKKKGKVTKTKTSALTARTIIIPIQTKPSCADVLKKKKSLICEVCK